MTESRNPAIAALLLRLSLGTMFVAHALLKYFVFTLPGTAQFFESLGLPGFLGYATFAAELVGGDPADRRRAHPRRRTRARSDAARRHVGARGQRLAIQRAERRLGISGVLDDRARRAGVAGRRPVCAASVCQPDSTAYGLTADATRAALRSAARMANTHSKEMHMKLYYSPAACSLAPHIALEEAGLAYDLVKVDLRTHKLADGTDYYTINPKGYVPLLELDNGEHLSEVAVILQYIADRKPGTLAPAYGTMERYRVNEWLNFIATELHKQFGPLWHADTPEATKATQRAKLAKRFDLVARTLGKQPYLTGESFRNRRCVPVHDRQLVGHAEGRSRALARAAEIPGARRRAAEGACGAQGRAPGQGSGARRRLSGTTSAAGARKRYFNLHRIDHVPTAHAVPFARLADERHRADARRAPRGRSSGARCRSRARC